MPAHDKLIVNLRNLASTPVSGKILIHSLNGKMSLMENFLESDLEKELDVSDFATGVYVLSIVSEKGSSLSKSRIEIR